MMEVTEFKTDEQKHVDEIVDLFQRRTKFVNIHYDVKEMLTGPYLIFFVENPTERFFKLLDETHQDLSNDNIFRMRATLQRRPKSPNDRLHIPETKRLRTILSESLTVTRHSFEDDFFSRYIPSVFDAEQQILAGGNHIVFGRRGAGKSSLLAYVMHNLRQKEKPYAWIDMQTYSGRSDFHVIINVFNEIIDQINLYDEIREKQTIIETLKQLENTSREIEKEFDHFLPKIRFFLNSNNQSSESIVIFLDDVHVIDQNLQPKLLNKLHSVCHGNRIFLKISGIEQFVKLWEPSKRIGLETPHDIQVIKLDYNLTIPDKSKQHINEILDAHAVYCGLPDIKYLCGHGVLDRLTWVAAGVPRDALNLFTQAMSRAMVKNQKKVSVTSINSAASEMTEEKLRDIQKDASGEFDSAKSLLEAIKDFCINQKRKNAFLVEIQNENPTFQQIEKLIALRLLHVLSEGITPHKAGRRFMALMLDYGFYVGIRAAQSVDLFHKEPTQILAKELRKLPIYGIDK